LVLIAGLCTVYTWLKCCPCGRQSPAASQGPTCLQDQAATKSNIFAAPARLTNNPGESRQVETLTRDEFVTCVTQFEQIEWLQKGAVALADRLIFTQAAERIAVTDAFDFLLEASLPVTNWPHERYYLTAISSLRFRSLIPHIAAIISCSQSTDSMHRAGICIGYLTSLEHPDALRAYLMLNEQIPSNSVLRQGIIPKWTDGLPKYHRQDCLPIFLEIARNPDKYNWAEWVTAAVGALTWYTNDEAVVELKRSFQTMRDWKKYWPYHNPGVDLYRGHVYIGLQRELIEGKQHMPRIPPPLLDE